jgi:hypothetical protein
MKKLHTTLHCRKSGRCDFFSGKKDFIFLSLCMILKDFGNDFTLPNSNAKAFVVILLIYK